MEVVGRRQRKRGSARATLTEWGSTQYRSGRGSAVPAFAPRRVGQGVPMQPVPMSGQTGDPQVATWSVADAIMASTFADDIEADEYVVGQEDDDDDPDVADEPRIARWSTWNTPRYDVERFYQVEADQKCPPVCPKRPSDRYLPTVNDADEKALRTFVRACIREVNAVAAGNVRGVVTPLGTGPKHPKPEDRKGSKKRNRRRLQLGAEAFGGGEYEDD